MRQRKENQHEEEDRSDGGGRRGRAAAGAPHAAADFDNAGRFKVATPPLLCEINAEVTKPARRRRVVPNRASQVCRFIQCRRSGLSLDISLSTPA